jgi:hypothetical protein
LQKVRRTVSQRLKPKLFVTLYGTAEPVPFRSPMSRIVAENLTRLGSAAQTKRSSHTPSLAPGIGGAKAHDHFSNTLPQR